MPLDSGFFMENLVLYPLRKITSLPMWLWIVAPLSIFPIFLIGLTLAFSNFFGLFDRSFPTDAELESTFSRNQDAFEKLRQMSSVDSTKIQVSNSPQNFIINNAGASKPFMISGERWEEYKGIFNKLPRSKLTGY